MPNAILPKLNCVKNANNRLETCLTDGLVHISSTCEQNIVEQTWSLQSIIKQVLYRVSLENTAFLVIIEHRKHSKTFTLRIGNNPMVGMTVAVAVSIEEAAKEGKF